MKERQYTQNDVTIRYTTLEDGLFLEKWLNDPEVLPGFPVQTELEIKDSVKYWINFYQYKSSLTIEVEGKVAGIATLVLMPYVKICHHSLLSIIVAKEFRNKGLGSLLINNLLHLAKNSFRLTVVYLEVYEGNPAISLYKRFGFKEVGFQKHFIKEGDKFLGKITMERLI